MFGFFSDFFDSAVDIVADVGSAAFEFTGDVLGGAVDAGVYVAKGVGSIAEGTFDVATDMFGATVDAGIYVAEGLGSFAGGTVDIVTDILGIALAPIFDPTHFDPKKEQQRQDAERRLERQLGQLRHNSEQAIKTYEAEAQAKYNSNWMTASHTLSKQQKHLRYVAFQQLHAERDTVKQYISQLKPLKNAANAKLKNCTDSTLRAQLLAETRAINALLKPIYAQLQQIKRQFDELHHTQS